MGTLKNETTRSQCAAIRRHLLRYGRIDAPTAMKICECNRLGARVFDLRNDPVDPLDIVTDYGMKKNKYGHQTRFAIYRLRKGSAA